MSDAADNRSWESVESTFQVSAIIGAVLICVFEACRHIRGGRTSAYGGNYVSFTLLPYGNHRKSSRYMDDPDGMGELEFGPQLPPRPWYPGGWLQAVISVDGEQQLLDLVGLDAFMLLRFIKMQARIFFFCSFWGITVLIPVYLTGDQEKSDSFYKSTMANMEQQSRRLWVGTVMAYLFVMFAMYQIAKEYAEFVDLRHQFFLHGSRETSPQSRYTILVENVPSHLRTSAALKRYFDELFPGKVHSAVVARNVSSLARLMRQREQVASLLERYKLLNHFESDNAPHEISPWGYYGGEDGSTGAPRDAAAASYRVLARKETTQEHYTRLARTTFCCERTLPVHAVEFLEFLLPLLNDEVISQQERHLDDASAADTVAKMPLLSGLLFRMEEELNAAISCPRHLIEPSPDRPAPASGDSADVEQAFADEDDLPERPPFLHQGTRERTMSNASSSQAGGVRRHGPQLRIRHGKSLRRQLSGLARARSQGGTSFASSTAGSPKQEASESLRSNLLDDEYPVAGSPALGAPRPTSTSPRRREDTPVTDYGTLATGANETIPEEDSRPLSTKIREALRSLAAGVGSTAVSGTTAVGRTGIRQVLNGAQFAVNGIVGGAGNTVSVLEALTVGSPASDTAFVTFTSLAAKESAHQTLLTHQGYRGKRMEVVRAPEPRDVIWQNVHYSMKENETRRTLAGIAFGIITILFNIPIAFCVAATNEDTLLKAFPGLQSVKDERWFDVSVAYLPTLAALGLVQLMPLIFLLSAQFYEHYKGEIEVQGVILSRFFNVQLAFVYVTVTAGSVTDAIFDIVEDPGSILFILGNALPAQASYFMGLMVIKIFQGLTWELSRLHVLVPYLLAGKSNHKTMGEREILSRNDPRAFPYGWVYPAILVSSIVGFCFMVVCPLVSIVCCAYFFYTYVVYKHQLMFVYINASESGGAFFFPAFRRTITAMLAGQLTLAGYLGIKEAFAQTGFVLVLPILTLLFAKMLQERYERPANTLSYEQASYVDRILDSRAARAKKDSADGSTAEEAKFAEITELDPDLPDDDEYLDWRPHFNRTTYLQPELRSTEPLEPMPSRWLK